MAMRLIGSLSILVILVQDVSSLNHGAFFSTTPQHDVTTDDDGQGVPGPFFDPSFFTPLPPPPLYPTVPAPPSTPYPTVKYVPPTKPGVYPTKPPAYPPTAPPLTPYPPPYPAPTPYPTPYPTPRPTVGYVAPTKPEVYPTEPPYKAPTYRPTIKPTYPPPPPPVYPTAAPIKIDTRTSMYSSQWAAEVRGCEYEDPQVFFNCHEGGLIKLVKAANAVCKNLSDDYLRCGQTHHDDDAYIEFTCTGIKSEHLYVSASVGPSKLTECSNDGSAVILLTLNRYCYGQDGEIYWDGQAQCEDGEPWTRNSIDFCASPAVCTTGVSPCDELDMGSVTIVNVNENIQCSLLDKDHDLQQYEFKTSVLSSLNLVDWRFSGKGRGCLWTPSSLMLRCEGGGTLSFLEDYHFCTIVPEDNIAICDSFAPESTSKEEAIGLMVSCSGKKPYDLFLAVEIPSEVLDVSCDPHGTVIQSIMIARACGEYKTPEFEFVNEEGFCVDPEQVFVLDDDRSYCYVGDTCTFEEGCYVLQLPSVVATTATHLGGYCTYAV